MAENSYEFKKLADVEALEEVPENANALIEVDGAIKRVPGSGLGSSGGGGGDVAIAMFNLDDNTCNMTFAEVYERLTTGEPITFMVLRTVNDTLHCKAPTDVYYTGQVVVVTDLSSSRGEFYYDNQYGIVVLPEEEPE